MKSMHELLESSLNQRLDRASQVLSIPASDKMNFNRLRPTYIQAMLKVLDQSGAKNLVEFFSVLRNAGDTVDVVYQIDVLDCSTREEYVKLILGRTWELLGIDLTEVERESINLMNSSLHLFGTTVVVPHLQALLGC